MANFFTFHALVFLCVVATMFSAKKSFANEESYSSNQTGAVGLNTIPTARMDKTGTFRSGFSTSKPYNHAFIGLQIASPLYINLRQSMLASSITQTPTNVYPGMDVKLRIKKENRYIPEIAFGMNSIMGHKRFSSEYFALSKRYYNFDFTGGMAWGRMAGQGHIKNPFSRISPHFKNDRSFNDENSAAPSDWFTGNDLGFFGGVEYFTPISGLSLKADFNADSYAPEKYSFGFDKSSPWSFGFNYSPKKWASFGAAITGTQKIMARLSLQGNLFDWGGSSYKATTKVNDKIFDKKDIVISGSSVTGTLYLNSYEPSVMQIGRAAKFLASSANKNIKTIVIIPMSNGTKSASMTFSKRDLDQANLHHQGSPEEIWQDLEFKPVRTINFSKPSPRTYKLAPELSFSVGEEETTALYRAALVGEEQKNFGYGIVTGNSIRINIADNLHRIADFRTVNLESIRSDIDLFTLNRINIDKSYLSFLNTPITDFHFAATAGYLEEMFAGYGAEILYRPQQSAFSIGAEAWNIYKRDALSPLALGLTGNSYKTGFLNFNYEIPNTDITTFAKIGQFIGGDKGINTGAKITLSNGMKIGASVSLSNKNTKDVFEKNHNMQAGIELTMPFGNLKYLPQESEARINTAQIGRDDAAILQKPIDLYDVTEPTAYRHLARNWQEVLN